MHIGGSVLDGDDAVGDGGGVCMTVATRSNVIENATVTMSNVVATGNTANSGASPCVARQCPTTTVRLACIDITSVA